MLGQTDRIAFHGEGSVAVDSWVGAGVEITQPIGAVADDAAAVAGVRGGCWCGRERSLRRQWIHRGTGWRGRGAERLLRRSSRPPWVRQTRC